jgi:hypothetical protein
MDRLYVFNVFNSVQYEVTCRVLTLFGCRLEKINTDTKLADENFVLIPPGAGSTPLNCYEFKTTLEDLTRKIVARARNDYPICNQMLCWDVRFEDKHIRNDAYGLSIFGRLTELVNHIRNNECPRNISLFQLKAAREPEILKTIRFLIHELNKSGNNQEGVAIEAKRILEIFSSGKNVNLPDEILIERLEFYYKQILKKDCSKK